MPEAADAAHFLSFDIGTRNLGVAASSVLPGGRATLRWLGTADVSASSADRVVRRLWEYLDRVMAALRWARFTVLVEQQPSKARSLMRTVELATRHYFLMLQHRAAAAVVVKSVSPRTKLARPVQYARGATKAQQYRARKQAAVAEAADAVAALEGAADFLRAGKGDDAADALLYHVRHAGASSFVGIDRGALQRVAVEPGEAAVLEAVPRQRASRRRARPGVDCESREVGGQAAGAAVRGPPAAARQAVGEPAESAAAAPPQEDGERAAAHR